MKTRSEVRAEIVALVTQYPGISSREIVETLGIPAQDLSAITSYLRDRKNQIVNRGKDGRSFLWYPVTPESENNTPYIREARDILEGLRDTPVAHREKYLASRLQKLIEGES